MIGDQIPDSHPARQRRPQGGTRPAPRRVSSSIFLPRHFLRSRRAHAVELGPSRGEPGQVTPAADLAFDAESEHVPATGA